MPVIINGSTGISGTDGSAGTPAVQGADSNTGLFFPAADQIAFAEGGVEAMRIDASGQVGIGTSSPDRRLKIGGAGASFGIDAGSGQLAIDPVSGGVAQIDVSGANALRFNTNSAERMRVSSIGHVGIGTNNPEARLHVSNTTDSVILNQAISGGSNWYVGRNVNAYILHNESNTPMIFTTNGSERMRINAEGRVQMGITGRFAGLNVGATQAGDWNNRTLLLENNGGVQPGIGFHAPASATAGVFKFWGPEARFECRSGGDDGWLNILANSCISVSDYRLKENVTPFSGGLSAVMQLEPVSFKWKGKDEDAVGFLAHEVQSAIPTAVRGDKDGMYDENTPLHQGLDPLQVIAVLVSAVKEQQAQMEELKARVAALEAA